MGFLSEFRNLGFLSPGILSLGILSVGILSAGFLSCGVFVMDSDVTYRILISFEAWCMQKLTAAVPIARK